MAANILAGVPRGAVNSTGGIEYFLIADFNSVTVTEAAGIATVLIPGVAGADGTPVAKTNNPFIAYWPRKESSSIGETWTGNVPTGQGFSEQIATLIFSKRDTAKRNDIKMLAHLETIVIGVDFNGYAELMGMRSGCDLITTPAGSGVAGGDLNGYTLTLRAKDPDFMPAVDIDTIKVLSVPKA